MEHRGWTVAVLAVAAAGLSVSAVAQPPAPGVTDFTRAEVGAIQSGDIVEALAVPRGTIINPAEPPTARLPILFEFDSAKLQPEARQLLEKVSAALGSSDLTPFQFGIEGHTDSLGSEDYNERLSAQRAQAVKAFLASRGVPAKRLHAVGKGESKPMAPNSDEAGRQRNRRVELVNLGSR